MLNPNECFVRNPIEALNEAIAAGVLSSGNGSTNAARDYMYMYTDNSGVDYFKHIDTRAYVLAPPPTGLS